MSHWQEYPACWANVRPPLRPTADVINRIVALAGSQSHPVLLLGVTSELAQAFEQVYAVDKCSAMIAKVWPGDQAQKQALCANWLDLAGMDDRFAAIIGDGSLNNLVYPHEMTLLLARLIPFLRAGGRFVCRLFERPQRPITLSDLRTSASGKTGIGFHGFKLQLAMYLAEVNGASIPVALILRRFNEVFPDRDELAARSGWTRPVIDTMDLYKESAVVYAFPNRQEFRAILPQNIKDIRFESCGTYDLSQCCPILAFEKA
jgi:hypothetical protein